MHKHSAHALCDAIAKGEITAISVIEKALSRIQKLDPQIGAFLAVFADKAFDKAKKIDEKRKNGQKLGKLAGVPIALKDNIHVLGQITTCGSKFLTNYKAVFDATVTHLLEQEDAIIIGKTNLDEFAMGSSTENSAFHPTKNPWNLACSPGGSSGGSAAAVAARLCPLAFGSDTGGSIRQPASFSGIVGYKPTYGRVSRYGLVAFGSSLDQIGPFATNVVDAALALEVVGRHCQHDSTSLSLPQEPYVQKLSSSIAGSIIGVPWKFLEGLSVEARKNFDQALEVYKEMGCKIIDVNLDLLQYSIAIYYILATAEASTNLARFDGVRYGRRSSRSATVDDLFDHSREEGFGREVKRRILLGTYVLSSGYKDSYYRKAQQVRALVIEKFKKAFQTCQIIATPTSPTSAFEIGKIQDPVQMYLQDMYTIPANLAGLPSISVPSGLCPEGKPLGLHLTGPQMHDADVLRFAHHYEQAAGFFTNIPPLVDTL